MGELRWAFAWFLEWGPSAQLVPRWDILVTVTASCCSSAKGGKVTECSLHHRIKAWFTDQGDRGQPVLWFQWDLDQPLAARFCFLAVGRMWYLWAWPRRLVSKPQERLSTHGFLGSPWGWETQPWMLCGPPELAVFSNTFISSWCGSVVQCCRWMNALCSKRHGAWPHVV